MKPVTRAKLDLIVSVAAWGTIGLFVRAIPLPSSVIALARGAIAVVFLVIFLCCRRSAFDRAAIQAQWKLLVLSGACISLNWITLFESYRYTTVATATLCYYMAPVFITLASPFLFHESLNARKLLCVLGALCGMLFVSGIPQSGLPETDEAMGILLALVSAVFYATDVSINKLLDHVPTYERTVTQLIVATAVLLPYVLLTEDLSTMRLTLTGGVLLAILGVFHTGWCYALYFGAMAHLSAQTMALFSYIDPIVAIFLSALFLKEPLGWSGLLGAVLVLGSTLVSELPMGHASPASIGAHTE